ncbi:MAG: heme ABC exporter ATP-binding protein CcmA [Gemmatimonadetes bacterium]|nr:heme ABC exporter ATP-binding protein CcmA [Gemmatimonadota bacterium]
MSGEQDGRNRRGAPETAALELDKIARRFGRRWALRGVTLRVAPGEVVALVGHNGSGKTTLLRVAATAIRPTRGSGRVCGRDILREPAAVRPLVGFLGHSPGLYEDLTASENLLFSLRMAGVAADSRAVAGALAEVGLTREAGEMVRYFSAGMRRRLALARLLLRPGRLVLLDEPYASFDPEGVERVNRLVREQRAHGGAVILATHDLARAAEVADRMVELVAGRLLEGKLPRGNGAAGAGERGAMGQPLALQESSGL